MKRALIRRFPLGILIIAAVSVVTLVVFRSRETPPAAAPSSLPAAKSWRTVTTGWNLPMPATESHAGIAVNRISFEPGADGASVTLRQLVIERRQPPSNLNRSEFILTLANTYVAQPSGHGVQRGPGHGQARTRFGDNLRIAGPAMDLGWSSADQLLLTLDQWIVRLPGRRAACAEEPCYIFLTLNEWDTTGQHTAHSRSYPINYR